MLKVVLVDDEDIIREGIVKGVNWNDLGMVVVGTAEDGEQALEVIENTRPDIIITDIKMPFIDGLELVGRIKPVYPEMYIIIISGHDEFQFAQKAIKLGAYDYILKPIELDYLKELLIKIKSEHDIKKRKDIEINSLKERMVENFHLIRGNFFRDLIYGKIDSKDLPAKMQYFSIEQFKTCCVVMIVQMDDYYLVTENVDSDEKRILETSLHGLIGESISDGSNVAIFENGNYESVICLLDGHKEVLKAKAIELTKKIRSIVEENALYTVTIAVGGTYSSMQYLSQSFNEALETLEYKFIIGKNRDIYYGEIADMPQKQALPEVYNDSDLIYAIKIADKKLIEQRLKVLMTEILTHGSNSYFFMQMVISNIYTQALKALKESGGSAEEVFTNPLEVYKKIMVYQTVEGIINELTNTLFSIADYIDVKRNGRFDHVIEKAKKYIKLNYIKNTLSLDEVANFVNMSACYFSAVFKQEARETFIDYLTGVRMEKAKELLTVSGYKSYEISYMVGYDNPTYFSTTFKKYTGTTPTEFRSIRLK